MIWYKWLLEWTEEGIYDLLQQHSYSFPCSYRSVIIRRNLTLYPVASFNMYPISLRKNTIKLCCANHLLKYGALALIHAIKHTCGFWMNCCCSLVKVSFSEVSMWNYATLSSRFLYSTWKRFWMQRKNSLVTNGAGALFPSLWWHKKEELLEYWLVLVGGNKNRRKLKSWELNSHVILFPFSKCGACSFSLFLIFLSACLLLCSVIIHKCDQVGYCM